MGDYDRKDYDRKDDLKTKTIKRLCEEVARDLVNHLGVQVPEARDEIHDRLENQCLVNNGLPPIAKDSPSR